MTYLKRTIRRYAYFYTNDHFRNLTRLFYLFFKNLFLVESNFYFPPFWRLSFHSPFNPPTACEKGRRTRRIKKQERGKEREIKREEATREKGSSEGEVGKEEGHVSKKEVFNEMRKEKVTGDMLCR